MISLDGAVVPPLWPFEVANMVLNAVRRGRVTEKAMSQILTELGAMNTQIDEGSAMACWDITARIASKYRLSVYDAAYLELAHRSNLPLATLDRRLAEAARLAGVTVI
jgi:predicted nucleic acid-binding protein